MNNYYQTLGVDRTAGPDELKRAYRKLASQHHPDKGGDKHKFQEIEEAYRTLSDPQKRAMHDNPGMRPQGFNFTTGPGGFDFESIFDIFGAKFQHPHQQRRAQHAIMTLWVTLRDIAQGGRKTISVGSVHGNSTVEIEIPLGINDGDSVQYGGIGPGGMDLVVTYRIHPDPRWARHALNLQAEETVSIWDLILGTELPIRDILGNTLSLTVPARTQPGTVLRLRQRGLTDRSGKIGDLLIRIQGIIPENISAELLEHINQNCGQ